MYGLFFLLYIDDQTRNSNLSVFVNFSYFTSYFTQNKPQNLYDKILCHYTSSL